MKNRERKRIPAKPIPLTEVEQRLRHLRATDPRLENPAPLPPATPPKKIGIVRRTFGNYPELRTPQPRGTVEARPAHQQPENVRVQNVAEGIGHLIVSQPTSSFEARKAEILADAAAAAQRQRLEDPNALLFRPDAQGAPGQPENPYGFPTEEPR